MSRRAIPIAVIVIVAGGFIMVQYWPSQNRPRETTSPPSASEPTATLTGPEISDPISHPKDRVTKKPLGIYVTPKNSPVQPERFTGYHVGVDFETTEAEQNVDVPVYVLCDGLLVQKRTATGYGGVLVQRCNLKGQDVVVIYGHVRLSSVSAVISQQLTHGQQIGLLGTGYSPETDGERKHLHLGIHKGTVITIAGYVQNKSQVGEWLNVLDYL